MCQHTFNPSNPQPLIRENTHKNPGLTRYQQHHNLKLYPKPCPKKKPSLNQNSSLSRKPEHHLRSSNLRWQNGMHLGTYTYSTNIQLTHPALTPDLTENHPHKTPNPKQSPSINKPTPCPQTPASSNLPTPTRKPQGICIMQYRLRNRNRRRW